jgi:hypothetical protein
MLDKLPAVAPCPFTLLGLKITFKTNTPYCKTQTFYEKLFDLPHQHLAATVSLRSRKYPFQKKKLKHVLSTIVQMLDVITSFNCNCYPPNEGLKK